MFLRMLQCGVAVILVLASSSIAAAELVHFTSGRTLSVKGHRTDGDAYVFQLRGGGEVVCERSLVEKFAEDEVPYPEPVASVPEAAPGTPRVLTGAVPYQDIIETAAARHKVDPQLVSALIRVESAYRPNARSRKGAMGLMQLMPGTARQYDVSNPYDPTDNINGGVAHLRSLLDRFDVRLALAAYNAGEGAVRRFGGVPPYPETRNYVQRILQLTSAAR